MDVLSKILSKMPRELFTRDKSERTCCRRYAIWYMLRENGYSYSFIGKMFGRDHCTVMSGIKQIKAWLSVHDRQAMEAMLFVEKFNLPKYMSKKTHFLEIEPPKYSDSKETFEIANFKCPTCNGYGRHTMHQTGYDRYEAETCVRCGGTGSLTGKITIEWKKGND